MVLNPTRRGFLAGTGAAILSGAAAPARADSGTGAIRGLVPQEVRSRYDLTVMQRRLTVAGQRASQACIDGGLPGPVLRLREGDVAELTVINALDEDTSIHWHGLRVPANMDGVPGLSFAGIKPGEKFTYRFPLKQSGTYWYHSHSGMQETQAVYGAMVIDPAGDDPDACPYDYVVMLNDWSDVPGEKILSNLKFSGDYYNFRQRTAFSFPAEAEKHGAAAALQDRLRWSRMRMSATDISDVSGIIYTYLMNGLGPDENWTGLFSPGQKVRLRFINASAMTFFDVRIPGLEMKIIQADGNAVEPVSVDEFRIGVAETYDVTVRPEGDRAWTIFAQSEDRTGYARGTLAPRPGMHAEIPPMDPRPVRTMIDMGMGNMKSMPGMKHAGTGSSHAGMPSMDMPGMDMSRMDMHGDMKASAGSSHARTDTGMEDMDMDMGEGHMMHHMPEKTVSYAKDYLPASVRVDPGSPGLTVENQNIAQVPVSRLGDPGDGLEDNGRRVLDYTMLRARVPASDPRPPSREIVLHLTGNMERYIWGFDGKKFSESGPVRLRTGERVRLVLINDTMMEHPIHLHGLWSEIENGQNEYRPVKHTIISQPGSRLSYLVSADTPGMWAFHCHLMYHMHAGMFRTVIVS
ncbi:copper resistance system multicopper oxidase [Acetobacter sp. AN02]|uniref:copper resistance system multicopper oxidase n=1 Tax=Acetobacter sp. AN02 TaxID=2894186 RepID=UPI00243467D4|nr:copper resistance system multicopper oxidase [Acetobacter sp. AN02]MDG6095221.1 copper resistance system multicopper oxidase [Acetobacter sp. AN02]